MNWSDEATEMFAELLRLIPPGARDAVEELAVSRAEAIAEEEEEDEVAMEMAIQALVECTPERMKARLREGLTYHGIDMHDYEENE